MDFWIRQKEMTGKFWRFLVLFLERFSCFPGQLESLSTRRMVNRASQASLMEQFTEASPLKPLAPQGRQVVDLGNPWKLKYLFKVPNVPRYLGIWLHKSFFWRLLVHHSFGPQFFGTSCTRGTCSFSFCIFHASWVIVMIVIAFELITIIYHFKSQIRKSLIRKNQNQSEPIIFAVHFWTWEASGTYGLFAVWETHRFTVSAFHRGQEQIHPRMLSSQGDFRY